MSDEPAITKKDLLEGFKFVLETSLERFNDLTLPRQEREKWFKAYSDALCKSASLIRETDMDQLEADFKELVDKYEKLTEGQ